MASVSVACLLALVLSARQELPALVLAEWDGVGARSSLPANQRLNSVVAARTVPHALWVTWTRLARALVASSLACVLTAVKRFATDSPTGKALAPTGSHPLFLAAKARVGDLDAAWKARSLVAALLALVLEAVQQLAALVTAGKLCACC